MAGNIYQEYPRQPDFDPNCSVNYIYNTLPQPSCLPPQRRLPITECRPTQQYPRRTYVQGPTSSAKALYTGIPNYYPYIFDSKPVGTLYGHDFSRFTGPILDENGKPTYERLNYHYKIYPLTDRRVTEYRLEDPQALPYPTIARWTTYPVIRG
jgi:hypothetical protein